MLGCYQHSTRGIWALHTQGHSDSTNKVTDWSELAEALSHTQQGGVCQEIILTLCRVAPAYHSKGPGSGDSGRGLSLVGSCIEKRRGGWHGYSPHSGAEEEKVCLRD